MPKTIHQTEIFDDDIEIARGTMVHWLSGSWPGKIHSLDGGQTPSINLPNVNAISIIISYIRIVLSHALKNHSPGKIPGEMFEVELQTS